MLLLWSWLHIIREFFSVWCKFVTSCSLYRSSLLFYSLLYFLAHLLTGCEISCPFTNTTTTTTTSIIVYKADICGNFFLWGFGIHGLREGCRGWCENHLIITCQILQGLTMQFFNSKLVSPTLINKYCIFSDSGEEWGVSKNLVLEKLLFLKLCLHPICFWLFCFAASHSN